MGNPVYATTEYDGQYPKYDAGGNLLTRKRPVNRTVMDVPCAEVAELDTVRCEELLLRAESGMDEEAVLTKLRQPFTRDELEFVKYKLELILRAHGKGTPKQNQESGSRYTTLDRPVYDTGYRSGAQISFGSPVVTLQIPRTQEKRGCGNGRRTAGGSTGLLPGTRLSVLWRCGPCGGNRGCV